MISDTDFVAQFFDRDTTHEMADKGMNVMMEFWAYSERIDTILETLEKARVEIFEE